MEHARQHLHFTRSIQFEKCADNTAKKQVEGEAIKTKDNLCGLEEQASLLLDHQPEVWKPDCFSGRQSALL